MTIPPEGESPIYGVFFGTMGVTAAQVFASMGAAYGISRSAIGITHMGVMKPEMVMKSLVPGSLCFEIGLILVFSNYGRNHLDLRTCGFNYIVYSCQN